MFEIDEKIIADNRTLITVNDKKNNINAITKNGTINYVSQDNSLWLTTPIIRKSYINGEDYTKFFDRIITAKNNRDIQGSFSFDDDTEFKKSVLIKNDIIVDGNFTVLGKSSVVDTPKLSIEDNVIEINKNETNDGIALKNAGIAINRGKKPYSRIIYNETNKAFIFDSSANMDDNIVGNWILKAYTENVDDHIAGEIEALSKMTAPAASFNNISILDQATIKDLNVEGISKFKDAATFNKTVNITGALSVIDVTTLNALTVKKPAVFNDTVDIYKKLSVHDNMSIAELLELEKGLKIDSVGADITGDVSIKGQSNLTGALTVSENGSFKKDLEVTSVTTTNDIVINNNLKSKTGEFTSNLNVDNNLLVKGTTTLNNDLTVTANNATISALTTINGKTTINNDLIIACNDKSENGNLTVNGHTRILKTLTVSNKSLFNSNVDVTADLTANNLTTKNKVIIAKNNNNGIYFWSPNNDYSIYLTDVNDETNGGGLIKNADVNMYFHMANNINNGFVFKNGQNNIFQIEGTGVIRSKDVMFIKNKKVLTAANLGHAPKDEIAIDADSVDGIQGSNILLRDGTAAMEADLNMDNNSIIWHNKGQISYENNEEGLKKYNNITIKYPGVFNFNTTDNNKVFLSASGLNTDSINIIGENGLITGISDLYGKNGHVFSSKEGWLNINSEGEIHDHGVYFGSLIRTDTALLIGDEGKDFIVSSEAFKYKDEDVLTKAGVSQMHGDINLGTNRLAFINKEEDSKNGIAKSDAAYIYGEHIEPETSNLVLEIQDNGNDSIVFRGKTVDRGDNPISGDMLTLNLARITFGRTPYLGTNRLLHMGDTGAGHGLDVDKLDGKHYADLRNEFVNVSGDKMTGVLTMANNIVMDNTDCKIAFNKQGDSFISGYTVNSMENLLISSANKIYFNLGSKKTTYLDSDGKMYINNSKVLTTADMGENNKLDADTIDGRHFSDMQNIFVDASGDTMTGDLIIKKVSPVITLFSTDNDVNGRSSTAIKYKNINGQDFEMLFTEHDGQLPEQTFGVILKKSENNTQKGNKACLVVEGNIYSNDSKVLTIKDEGHGKKLDADTVDGKHASDLALANHNHDTRYTKREEIDLNNKYKIKYNNENNSLDFMYIGG